MMYGEKMRVRSREHLTPLMLLVQVVFPRDSLVHEASGSAIGSYNLPPADKKTKRASKWQENWKKYNMKQSKGVLHLYTVIFVAMISPLPLVVYMK